MALAETEIPLLIEIDGRAVRSQTLATSVGAYVFVIATVLADQAIDLHSTYTGHQRTKTLATHLLLARERYATIAAEHEHDELPVTHARRRCLFDHLHRLQDLLGELGLQAVIPIEDAAIQAIEG